MKIFLPVIFKSYYDDIFKWSVVENDANEFKLFKKFSDLEIYASLNIGKLMIFFFLICASVVLLRLTNN